MRFIAWAGWLSASVAILLRKLGFPALENYMVREAKRRGFWRE